MFRETKRSNSLLVASIVGAAFTFSGCTASSEPEPTEQRSAELQPPAVDSTIAIDGDWRTRAVQEVERVRSEHPELHATIASLEPRQTRAGFLRFTTSVIHDPAVAPVFLARLAEGGEPPAVRAAIVEALPRTGGEYAHAVLDLLSEESDPEVRAALVASLRRAPASAAVAGLERALHDDDPAIRTIAAETAAMHTEGHALADALRSTLADDHGPARAAAARALGVFGIVDGSSELAALVEDDVAEVRLEALRALTRVDPTAASRLGTLEVLQRDADPRVARLARTIRSE